MEIIDAPRQSGKTKTTMCWRWLALSEKHILLVANEQHRKVVIDSARSQENVDYSDQVVTVQAMRRHTGLPQGAIFAIDELDHVLSTIIGHSIEFATWTGPS